MFKKIQLLMVMALLMVGCVQSPTRNSRETTHAPYQKIGYLVNVRQYPTHTHIGTTALTNFSKNYHFNWRIPTYIEQKLSQNLSEIGDVKVINLRKYNIKPSEVNNLFKNINGQWVVAKGKKAIYQNLANRLGLSSIIIINESSKQAIKDCGLLGCKKFNAKGYGLLTRSFINSNKFISATPFYVHIYRLNPLKSLESQLTTINKSEKMTLVAVSKGSIVEPNKINFIYPRNFNRWSEEEFRPFRLPLIRYIDSMIRNVVEVVKH